MTLKRTAFKPREVAMSRGPISRAEPKPERKSRMRKCAVKTCRTPFPPRSIAHKCCSTSCALEHITAEKALKLKRERQEGLAKLKRRADYLKEAQVAFNRFIRERDKGRPCISSGVPLALEAVGGGYDCGHYRSVGSAPHLRFDERNAHGQTKKENRYLSGNATAYRIGLIKRIGLEVVEALEADDTPCKFTIDDLKAIRAHYTDKYKQLLRAG